MAENLKVRDIREECKYVLMWNVIALCAALSAVYLFMPYADGIHGRFSAAALAFNGCLTMLFMSISEKYAMNVSGGTLCEKLIITALSSLYSFIVMCLINAALFLSLKELMIDAVTAVCSIAAIYISDLLTQKYFSDPRRYRKQRLLIIVSDEKNFLRMKRAKYGALQNYDAWYETLKSVDKEEVSKFIKEKFPHYDAVCVFDDLYGPCYRMTVRAAIEMDKDLFIVPKLIDIGRMNSKIMLFDDIITFYTSRHAVSRVEEFVKRTMDIAFSVAGLIIAAVPMAIIAAAIKITSPGPLFYKQVRLTKGKREFEIYKFRTMIPDAEKLSGPKFAEKNDPRITSVGKIIRACRLDELPQFINILKGDMSLIGPRPERPMFVSKFEQEIDEYDIRFKMKAGLTSLSHVYGRYSTYIHDRTYYDLYYIMHYSLKLDIKIIFLTLKTMLMPSAAAGEGAFKKKTIIENINSKEGEAVENNKHKTDKGQQSEESEKIVL